MLNRLEVFCPNQDHCKVARGDLAEHLQRFCENNLCVNHEHGCEWRGKFPSLSKHVNSECLFVPVDCPKACGKVVLRSTLEKHCTTDCKVVIEQQKADAKRKRKAEAKLEQRIRKLESQCESLNPKAEDILQINAGGTVFFTSRQTLTKYPDSLLGVLFAEKTKRPLNKMKDGAIFLDIPPTTFSHVLAWLQGFPLSTDKIGSEILLNHARSLRLDALVSFLATGTSSSEDDDEEEEEDEVDENNGSFVVENVKKDAPILSRSWSFRFGYRITQEKLLNLMMMNGGSLSLPAANFSGLFFGGARLENSLLMGCNLSKSFFGYTNLTGSNLSGCDLRKADLTHANLTQVNLTNADLSNANLLNANLSKTNLVSAVLKGTKLSSDCCLKGADLTGQNLSGWDLSGYDLSNANLSNANLSNANLSNTLFLNTVFNAIHGIFLKSFGGYGANNGQFSNPSGVAVDGEGRIIVSDQSNNRVQIFDKNETHLKSFGGSGANNGQFQNPYGVAVDGEGRIIVSDRNNHRVQIFDKNGNHLKSFGGSGANNGQFSNPRGVAVDGEGRIIVFLLALSVFTSLSGALSSERMKSMETSAE